MSDTFWAATAGLSGLVLAIAAALAITTALRRRRREDRRPTAPEAALPSLLSQAIDQGTLTRQAAERIAAHTIDLDTDEPQLAWMVQLGASRPDLERLLRAQIDAAMTQHDLAIKQACLMMEPRAWLRASRVEALRQALLPAARFLRSPALDLHTPPELADLLSLFRGVLDDDPDAPRTWNTRFVQQEIKRFERFFDRVERQPLTRAQREACVINEDSNLVLAGAGSGKTSVIIGRAGYLVASGLAQPSDLLILTFGNKINKETQERLARHLPDPTGITTRTFHALGLDIIGRATGKKPRLSRLDDDKEALRAFVLRALTERSNQDADYAREVMTFLAFYGQAYRSPDAFESFEDYIAYMRQLQSGRGYRTLKGELLRSMGEVFLANFMLVNGVEYRYEENYRIDTRTSTQGQYRPDFWLPEHDLYIEHFGVNAEGRPPAYFNDPEGYLAGMAWKRACHARHGTTLMETASWELHAPDAVQRLEARFAAYGVPLRPCQVDEALVVDSNDTGSELQSLVKLIASFIALFKSSGRTLDDLHAEAVNATDAPRRTCFLRIFAPVLEAYNAALAASEDIDFNDMIAHATRLIEEGRYVSPWRFILVDEFQDISRARAALLRALLRSRTDASVFCVGDDWQAIFRFAGSDVTLTTGFEGFFGDAHVSTLDQTFRFCDQACAFSSAFIMKNREQREKVMRSARTSADPVTTLVLHSEEERSNALLRCLDEIAQEAPRGASVYLLTRYNTNKPDLTDLQRRYSQLSLSADTIHMSKGKEADYTLLLDVNRVFPSFPSLLGEDPIITAMLPVQETFPHAEERRLFYVAVTRARQRTFILANQHNYSTFVHELLAGHGREFTFTLRGATSAAAETQGRCPRCKGRFVLRKKDRGRGASFYGCSNYPWCRETAQLCSACNSAPFIRGRDQRQCAACGHAERRCPTCKTGHLVLRANKGRPFFGCSNYSSRGCGHMEWPRP